MSNGSLLHKFLHEYLQFGQNITQTLRIERGVLYSYGIAIAKYRGDWLYMCDTDDLPYKCDKHVNALNQAVMLSRHEIMRYNVPLKHVETS